jgi:putative Mg2+ transporter-C (MgtC) family protein
LADELGYRLAEGSITITRHNNQEEWHVILIAKTKQQVSITAITAGLQKCTYLSGY